MTEKIPMYMKLALAIVRDGSSSTNEFILAELAIRQNEEIEEYRNRLELTATDERGRVMEIQIGDCDGIACRDETIRLQDREIAKLRDLLRGDK